MNGIKAPGHRQDINKTSLAHLTIVPSFSPWHRPNSMTLTHHKQEARNKTDDAQAETLAPTSHA